jgi:cytochrome c biogenesis protein CcmG, thiol:disulfide interchange protein DsbE
MKAEILAPVRAAVLAALAFVLASAAPISMSAPPPSVKVGKPAPDFTLTLVDGSRVTLDDLRGNVIVLNFWATWCVPCRTELPTLDSFYGLTKDAGLRAFAVTTEGSVPLYKLKELFAAMKMPAVRSVRGPYGTIKAVPTNIVIDRNGIVRYAKAGAFDLDRLNALLVPLLNERVRPQPAS